MHHKDVRGDTMTEMTLYAKELLIRLHNRKIDIGTVANELDISPNKVDAIYKENIKEILDEFHELIDVNLGDEPDEEDDEVEPVDDDDTPEPPSDDDGEPADEPDEKPVDKPKKGKKGNRNDRARKAFLQRMEDKRKRDDDVQAMLRDNPIVVEAGEYSKDTAYTISQNNGDIPVVAFDEGDEVPDELPKMSIMTKEQYDKVTVPFALIIPYWNEDKEKVAIHPPTLLNKQD